MYLNVRQLSPQRDLTSYQNNVCNLTYIMKEMKRKLISRKSPISKFYILHLKFRDKTMDSVARLVQRFHESMCLSAPKPKTFQYYVLVGF